MANLNQKIVRHQLPLRFAKGHVKTSKPSDKGKNQKTLSETITRTYWVINNVLPNISQLYNR